MQRHPCGTLHSALWNSRFLPSILLFSVHFLHLFLLKVCRAMLESNRKLLCFILRPVSALYSETFIHSNVYSRNAPLYPQRLWSSRCHHSGVLFSLWGYYSLLSRQDFFFWPIFLWNFYTLKVLEPEPHCLAYLIPFMIL